MSQYIDSSLKKVAKGSGIVFSGTLAGMVLGLAGKVLIVRYISPSQYGLITLALTVTGLAGSIFSLGLPGGVPKLISQFRGTSENGKIWGVIRSSIFIATVMGIFGALLIFLFRQLISRAFNAPQLSSVLSVLVFSIPFSVIIGILISIFRGLDKTTPKVLFTNLLRPILKILLVSSVIIFGLGFRGIVYIHLLLPILIMFIFAFFSHRKIPELIPNAKTVPMASELLFFSLPLLGANIGYLVRQQSDIVLLGCFTNPELVGLFNVARPLAHYIALFLNSAAFIYLPVNSFLNSKEAYVEMDWLYVITTKWMFVITFPIFFLLITAPRAVLGFLYGTQYEPAYLALQILAAGYFSHTLAGLNGMTLMSMGENKFLMKVSLMSAGINVVLNILLIPRFGIEGAAIGTATAWIVSNVITSYKLYQVSGIHPIKRNYVKPAILTLIMACFIHLAMRSFGLQPPVSIFVLGSVFAISSLSSVFLTRSIEKEDVMLFNALKQKLGVNLPF